MLCVVVSKCNYTILCYVMSHYTILLYYYIILFYIVLYRHYSETIYVGFVLYVDMPQPTTPLTISDPRGAPPVEDFEWFQET